MEHPEALNQAEPQASGPAPSPARGGPWDELRGWVRDILIACGLALLIIFFLYQPVKVEGTSMTPLLHDQERIFINKFIYKYEPIQRGDVVVFWYPRDESKSFIKRVVGLPEEKVELRHGRLYVNDRLVEEPYIPPQFADLSSFGPTRVPKGEYFLLGDHRSSSNDSRVFGPVPEEKIYGKAVFAYWPMDRFGAIPAYADQK